MVGSSAFGANRNRVELEVNDGFHDADWSDLMETQLEELVLVNLDTMFKSAIKKIVSCGYTEEAAKKGAFSGEKIVVKKIKPHSAERVLVKETKLHLAQKELYKSKERLKSAETTKIGALTELERAKRTVDDLKKKLEIVNEAKATAIKAAEAAKNQAKQFETGETNPNGGLTHDLDNTKQQYAAVFTELDAAKQELRRIRHDHEAALEEQNAAIKQETESELIKKVNLDRAGEISKEILYVQKTIEQVKLAIMEAHQEQEKVYEEKNVHRPLDRTHPVPPT